VVWVRIDDHWGLHPKVLGTGYAGMGLFVWGLTYCNLQLTDGFVPNGAWPGMAGAAAAVQALVRAGLWEPAEGGYQVHDYAVYQWTRERIAAEHAQKSAAGKLGADARWHPNGIAE